MKRRTLLLLEPCPLVCLGFEQLASKNDHLEIVGQLDSERGLPEILRKMQPDLFVFEPFLKNPSDCGWVESLRKNFPTLGLLAFSSHADLPGLKRLLKFGIQALLLKSARPDEMEAAIGAVSTGQFYIQPSLESAFCQRTLGIRPAAQTSFYAPRISPREQEVLRLIVEEYTSREISEKLFISYETVETHRTHLIQKLGVKNTAGMVREAVRGGLV